MFGLPFTQKASCLLLVLSLVLGPAVAIAASEGNDLPPDLDDFVASSTNAVKPLDDAGRLRRQTLREIAMAYGARGGLARRTYEINKSLEKNQLELDTIYNFQSLIIDGSIVPPVISEARNVFDQKGSTVLRIVDQVYAIVKQAHFSMVAPTWRSYLIHTYEASSAVTAPSIQPRDDELSDWKKWVAEGWAQGVRQAEGILDANMARLRRDFEGMARYHTLMLQGIVSKPFVAASNRGTTTNGQEMSVNEAVYQISILPEFSATQDQWKPIPTP